MHCETHPTKHKEEWMTQKWKTKNVHSPCFSPPAISWTETSAKHEGICAELLHGSGTLSDWSWAAPSLFPQSNAAAGRTYSAALNTCECIHNNKEKTNCVPKNLSARLLDCRARAVRKPLLSDGMMVDWQTKAPTKLEKSSDSATMSFRVTSVILSVQIAIFFPCGQSGKREKLLVVDKMRKFGKREIANLLIANWMRFITLPYNKLMSLCVCHKSDKPQQTVPLSKHPLKPCTDSEIQCHLWQVTYQKSVLWSTLLCLSWQHSVYLQSIVKCLQRKTLFPLPLNNIL